MARGKIPPVAVMDGAALLIFVVVGVAIHGAVSPVAVIRDAAVGIMLRQAWVGRLPSRATVAFLSAALPLTLAFLVTGRIVTTLATRVMRSSS